MKANYTLIITVALALLAGYGLFHFKASLGILVVPLFIALVVFVTLRLYRLLEKDDDTETKD